MIPPVEPVQTVASPGRRHTARLQRNYYNRRPLLSVELHTFGPFWRTVYYEPARAAGGPEERDAELTWSPDGTRLQLRVNQTNLLWEKTFPR
jgi:hypothetical protein